MHPGSGAGGSARPRVRVREREQLQGGPDALPTPLVLLIDLLDPGSIRGDPDQVVLLQIDVRPQPRQEAFFSHHLALPAQTVSGWGRWPRLSRFMVARYAT